MSRLRNALFLAASLMMAVPAVASAQFTYVGDWRVGDGPAYYNGVPVYTGQEAAALLFGGSASDYFISTLGTNTGTINNTAWYDVYGVGPSQHAQDYSSNSGGANYDTPGDASAYVCDNTFAGGGDYCNPPVGSAAYTNYAFRVEVTPTPEPASLVLLGTGLVGVIGFARRRRSN